MKIFSARNKSDRPNSRNGIFMRFPYPKVVLEPRRPCSLGEKKPLDGRAVGRLGCFGSVSGPFAELAI